MTETSAIRYRVVDFLKQYAPFQAMEEEDLLSLVARGRVRFHEEGEYLYWQGKALGPFLLVVQQGTVSLWEDVGAGEQLRDIRGPGDWLGIDRFLGSTTYLHSAKATCDVLLYALETADLEPLLQEYPAAARYMAAHASVKASYDATDHKKGVHQTFVYEIVAERPLLTCHIDDSVRDVAQRMSDAGAGAMAAVDSAGGLLGVVTTARLLRWIGDGGGDSSAAVGLVLDRQPQTVAPEATVEGCLLAMAESGADVTAITDGGLAGEQLRALVTVGDLATAFGEHPLQLLRDVAHAANPEALRILNQRARGLILDHLSSPAAVDWLSRFCTLFDSAIVGRALDLAGVPRQADATTGPFAWFYFGASGRSESITALTPQIGLVFDSPDSDATRFLAWHRSFVEVLAASGYVPVRPLSDTDVRFRCASMAEWEDRFRLWVRDPVANQLYRARPMFDLRPAFGPSPLLERLAALAGEEVAAAEGFLQVLAHDCLGNLPPLSFYQDLVVDDTGEQNDVLHFERSALRPLVDVGRVWGMAAGRVFESSSLDRFAAAAKRFSDAAPVFRDAADTVRLILYHQARSGLHRGDGGTEIPPSSLSHHDRRVLKTGFRSILRMLEFTAAREWRPTA